MRVCGPDPSVRTEHGAVDLDEIGEAMADLDKGEVARTVIVFGG